MEPKEFRQPPTPASQSSKPAPEPPKYESRTFGDLGTGPWTNLFNPGEKIPVSDRPVPMNAIRTEEWSGVIKRLTNDVVKPAC
jgi:hypothetical protein